ncbi:MAG: hypothetical protein WA210_03700 [Burkholderiaceae bacterium]
MHVLIPFASSHSEAASQVLQDLALPALTELLRRLRPTLRCDGDEATLSAPHERALAAAWSWPYVDGALPWAAHAAATDGIAVGEQAWGLLTPAHWATGSAHVTMIDPTALALGEAESRLLFDAIRPLFDTEGFALHWGAPLRWYASHASLAGLACASLDRVMGRNIDTWLPQSAQAPASRLLQRLQSEVQLLLYAHPINQLREDRHALTVNSYWLSGCGAYREQAGPHIEVLEALRAPMLANDWAAWVEAWQVLDAGPMTDLLKRSTAGEDLTLTLCGERHAQRFESQARSLWERAASRWRSRPASGVLEAL